MKTGKHKIEKLLCIGDVVWSATGKEMKVTHVGHEGFETEEDYFSYDEHRSLFFLTEYGYENFIKERKNK